MELLLTDTAVSTHLPTVIPADATQLIAKPWFAATPGFDAYDAAKWAQRLERAIHGDRTALNQLDAAGFTLQVL